jgi:hypothetical protein
MFRRGEWRVGWLGFEGEAKSAYVKVLAKDSSDNILLAKVTTAAQIPSSVAGYAYGCILIIADSGLIYSNTGGASSCTFSLAGLKSGAVTAGYIGSGAVTPIKMGVKNIVTGTAGASFTPSAADILNGYLKISTIGQTFNMTLPAAVNILAAFAGATGAWFDYTIYNGAGHTGIFDAGTGDTVIGGTAGTTQIPVGGVMSTQIVKTSDTTVDVVIKDIKLIT